MRCILIVCIIVAIYTTFSFSTNAFDLFQEGVAYHKEGEYEQAIEYYDMALETDPLLIDAWSNKGYALQSLGLYDEALENYYRALEIDSGFADAWYNKACLHSILGEKAKMIYNLRKAIEFKTELVDYAKTDPDFDNFKNDADFLDLLKGEE